MTRPSKFLCIVCISIFLSGCWDQTLLKDVRLYLAASFDVDTDGKIIDSVSSPIIKKADQGGGETESYQIITGIGNTPRAARSDIDKKGSKKFDGSKLRVLVFGSELAKQDMYSVLDLFYRDPKTSLSAKVVIAEGTGKDILQLNIKENKISQYLVELLESQEDASLIPKENIQSICAEMFDPGDDMILPFISRNEDGTLADVEGIALFNERKFTGQILTGNEARIFLLMDGSSGKEAGFTKEIINHENTTPRDFVSFNVKKAKRKLEVKIENNEVKANIHLKLKIALTEYARNELYKSQEIKNLSKKLSDLLTKDAEAAIQTLQQANSDSLGIGRRIIALHNEYWQQVDWIKEYPNISITPTVEVKIVGHGIIE
jgi:spore germination protein KC